MLPAGGPSERPWRRRPPVGARRYPGRVVGAPSIRRRAVGRLAAGAVLVAGLPACTSHPRPPTAAGPPGTIAWTTSPGHPGWQCGRLTVPLDHAGSPAAAGRTLTLAVNRHRAGSQRIGSLVLNPGGPGVSGVQFAFDAIDGFLDRTLVSRFDIVGFDPRGVGASEPVRCLDGPALDAFNHLDPAPADPAGVDALVAGARGFAAGCQARSGGLLAYVSTSEAAGDLDGLRAALGDSRLTYLGFSYGTLLGATYASLFPDRVRALALDGAEDPAVDPASVAVAQADGLERNLDAFLADCDARAARCGFATGPDGTHRAAFEALTGALAARPLPAGEGRTLGPAEAVYAIAWLLYSADWTTLAADLAAAQQGDGTPLLGQFDDYMGRQADGTYDNSEEAGAAIDCVDRPPVGPPGQIAALARSAAVGAPYFGPAVAWASVLCENWPVPAQGHSGPLRAPGAPPILVVGSTDDPVTPYAWAQALVAELGDAVLATRVGDGHTAYPRSRCTRALVDAYLLTLRLPGPASARCAQ